jgi:hypothetical protein
MRIVEIQHRNYSERQQSIIYETVEQVLADHPGARVKKNPVDAEDGDYVIQMMAG